MRSWAFLILEAATISIALVILRVFCTLLILVRISFDPAIAVSWLERAVLLEVLDRLVQRALVVLRQVLRLLDPVDQRAVLALDELAQRRFGRERLLHVDVVE